MNSHFLKTVYYNRCFFLSCLFFFLLGAITLMCWSKTELHLIFNNWHTEIGDAIFPILTHIGDGLAFGAVIIFFLCYRSYYMALVALSSFLLSSFLAQFLKRVFFYNALRPKNFFADPDILNFVEGVKVYGNHSFPSGHTTTAFAMFCLLILFTRKKSSFWAITSFLGACIIGFSRIYLQQHFFVDIYVGAILGIVVSTLTYSFYQQSKTSQCPRWGKCLFYKWINRNQLILPLER